MPDPADLMTPKPTDAPTGGDGPLGGVRIGFLGKLGTMTRAEARAIVTRLGGTFVVRPREDAENPRLDWLVLGADQIPWGDPATDLSPTYKAAAARGELLILTETAFWDRVWSLQPGIAKADPETRRLYTPAMLADLLGVSVHQIRRWMAKGLIVPARRVYRLPYFTFEEVATARRLVALLEGGLTVEAIRRQLDELRQILPGVDRPLAQLSLLAEGKELLVRRDGGLIDSGGQRRLDFGGPDGEDDEASDAESIGPATLQFPTAATPAPPVEAILALAAEREDAGEIEAALDLYRAALASVGPVPDLCFQVAELLYRLGDLSAARERYLMTLELDEEFVEARANLGCVFMELGRAEEAEAAFRGTLAVHADYADAHYHLARILDEEGRGDDARAHWVRFLELSPTSPWADEAAARLERS